MKVFILDVGKVGLPMAMRMLDDGHDVRLWMPPDKGGKPSPIGRGIVKVVPTWERSMDWADLIVMTDNMKLGDRIEPFFRKGYPIFGANKASAALELDRELGQDVLKKAGIDVLPYKTFSSYDAAIAYVVKEDKPFVSKPWGGNPDKSLSYVPKTPEDLISQLEHWKKQKLPGEFMLQEKVDGHEMAVGVWCGPQGFLPPINENWEEKRLLNGGLGPNTGEMGTIMRYVEKSKLFDKVLKPLEQEMVDRGYVGYVDVNCIITDDGTPWPLEFTMRFGWPHFNLCMNLHEVDSVEWMADLIDGQDSLRVKYDTTCLGVVMALKDYPWDLLPMEQSVGHPIRGLTPKILPYVHMSSVMRDTAPVRYAGKIAWKETYCTAGTYALVVTGLGETVTAAHDDAYAHVEKINWPPHKTYRTDIGARLEKDLPALQKLGYAKGMNYGKS